MSASVSSRCGVVSHLPHLGAVQGDPHPTSGQQLVVQEREVVHKQQVVEVAVAAVLPDDRGDLLGGVAGRVKPGTRVYVVVVSRTHAA